MELPAYVRRAFELSGDENPERGNAIAFQTTWGDFDAPTFVHVLEQGKQEERIFSLLALGWGMHKSAVSTVIPFLHSQYPLERWAATLSLSMMKEEIALPALVALITEFLPDPQYAPQGWIEWRYEEWRGLALEILGEWERPELVGTYLQMINIFYSYEQGYMGQLHPLVIKHQKNLWRLHQKEILYALGQLGKFEEVHTLERLVPASLFSLWRVYCAFGFLRIRTQYPDIFTNMSGKWDNPMLQSQVAQVLEQCFMLSNEEVQYCLEQYQEDVNNFFEHWGSYLNEEAEDDEIFATFNFPLKGQ